MTDVKAKNLTSTAAAAVGSCRIRGVYFVHPVGGGTVSFKDGGSGGTERLALTAPPAVGATYVDIPSDGIWFLADPYVTITTVTNVTFFYG